MKQFWGGIHEDHFSIPNRTEGPRVSHPLVPFNGKELVNSKRSSETTKVSMLFIKQKQDQILCLLIQSKGLGNISLGLYCSHECVLQKLILTPFMMFLLVSCTRLPPPPPQSY